MQVPRNEGQRHRLCRTYREYLLGMCIWCRFLPFSPGRHGSAHHFHQQLIGRRNGHPAQSSRTGITSGWDGNRAPLHRGSYLKAPLSLSIGQVGDAAFSDWISDRINIRRVSYLGPALGTAPGRSINKNRQWWCCHFTFTYLANIPYLNLVVSCRLF